MRSRSSTPDAGERLVEEKDARVGGERARERHALLLAARERRRVAVEEGRDLQRVDRLADAVRVAGRAEADVGPGRQVREEPGVLGDVAHEAALGRQSDAGHAVEQHRPLDHDAASRAAGGARPRSRGATSSPSPTAP